MGDNSVNIKVDINLDELEQLKKNITKDYYAKVGILAGKAGQIHKDTKLTNVELGMVHEFGSVTRNIPARSFLRMPLELKKDEIIKFLKSKGEEITEELSKKGLHDIFKQLGIKAEFIIQEAFGTNGFGEWKAHSSATEAIRKARIKTKKGKEQYIASILVDTGQLRRSITSKVAKGD